MTYIEFGYAFLLSYGFRVEFLQFGCLLIETSGHGSLESGGLIIIRVHFFGWCCLFAEILKIVLVELCIAVLKLQTAEVIGTIVMEHRSL